MQTVSVLENNDDYREILCCTIRGVKSLRLVSAYATAEEALLRFPQEKPAVAFVDIKLPRIDGIQCVRKLRAIVPALPTQFIMLTGHADDNLITEALEAGAYGYLLKSQTNRERLVRAIEEVIAGGAPMSPAIARKVVNHFKAKPHPANPLSSKEQEVLMLVSHGLSNKAIADKLGISVHTVHKHLASIYAKLKVHSRTDATLHFIHDQQRSQTEDNPKS